jgi:ribosomal-protein-alanine N-acetyltransferase
LNLRDRLPEAIETARLTLRAPRVSDLDDLLIGANDANVLHFTGLPLPYHEQHGRDFLGKGERRSHHPYVIADKASDRLMGVIGLYAHDDAPTELGYWLGEPHWGRGLAPEAIAGLLDAARGLAPIRAKVVSAHSRSIRVLEKTGFVVVDHTTSTLERHFGKPLTVMEWRE